MLLTSYQKQVQGENISGLTMTQNKNNDGNGINFCRARLNPQVPS